MRVRVAIAELADGRWQAWAEGPSPSPWTYRGWKYTAATKEACLEGYERSLRRYHGKLLRVELVDWRNL